MDRKENCVLCQIELDKEQEIIYETDHCLYIQKGSVQEVLEGSGLIIPKAHKQTVFELSPQEWQETYELLQKAKRYLQKRHKPDGYNIGWNIAKAGGQTIPHAHLHVIPRFSDETYAGKGIRYWMKQPENKRTINQDDK